MSIWAAMKMKAPLHFGLIICLLTLPVAAEPARMITDAEAPHWASVGRLNIAGNRSCTATLIAPDEAITAAHCLFHPVTHHRAEPGTIRLVLGFRRDEYAALVGVTATAILPGYVYDGQNANLGTISNDLALLHLDRAILPEEAVPLTVQDWPAGEETVDIVGYGRDRPMMASIRQFCHRVAGPDLPLLDCPVLPGLSGAPAVVSGGQVVVAMVSASVGAKVQGTGALLVPIAPHLEALRALIAK